MTVKIKTGQIIESHIKNCPIFTPVKISDEILDGLTVDDGFKLKPLPFGSDFLSLYLLKFLAGDKNTSSGFADCAIDELYLWGFARVGSNRFVKNVCAAVTRFSQGLKDLNSEDVSLEKLMAINTSLRPKQRNYGIRTNGMKAGDPKTNPNAFYCIEHKLVEDYMHDYIKFYNYNDGIINKGLFALMQFIFIHPFRDGNGRLSRLLLLNIVHKKYGFVFACLLSIYLKNINKKEYHNCIKSYRYGGIEVLKQFHAKAINWTVKSYNELHGLLSSYEQHIGHKHISSDEKFQQVIVRTPKNSQKKLDASIFQYHGNKGAHDIYINSALLNVLNQFDYYLRFELRTNLLSKASLR